MHILFAAASALIGIVSVFFPKLAIAGMVLGFIAYLTLPNRDSAKWMAKEKIWQAARISLLIALPCVVVGLFRFSVKEAMPGIIEAGREALTTRAIAALREIRFSQDLMREQHYWDPDGDGIGSAATVAELCGVLPLRGDEKNQTSKSWQKLIQRFKVFDKADDRVFARYAGYAFIIYLPQRDGTGSAKVPSDVDDERAERRFVAYAWPLDEGHGEHPVLFLDEHERIYQSDNTMQRYRGKEHMPNFDAALGASTMDYVHDGKPVVGQDGALWSVWKNKKPKAKLAGDDANP